MPSSIRLSESAVALLRVEIKGWKSKDTSRRLPAYRELADAGIMEPVPGSHTEFRFTEGLGGRRDEILREEEDRIERERYEPPDAGSLSEPARGLLQRLVRGERVEVDGANRPLFRELAAARILVLGHSFAKGDESAYCFTHWGWERRFEIAEMEPTFSTPVP